MKLNSKFIILFITFFIAISQMTAANSGGGHEGSEGAPKKSSKKKKGGSSDGEVKKEIRTEIRKIYIYPNKYYAGFTYIHGTDEKDFPIKILFDSSESCYLSCITKHQNQTIYTDEDGKFVIGSLQIKGHYHNNICEPYDFENIDISNKRDFTILCKKYFPDNCKDYSCLISQNTGKLYQNY